VKVTIFEDVMHHPSHLSTLAIHDRIAPPVSIPAGAAARPGQPGADLAYRKWQKIQIGPVGSLDTSQTHPTSF
jgi:hypothetical protein